MDRFTLLSSLLAALLLTACTAVDPPAPATSAQADGSPNTRVVTLTYGDDDAHRLDLHTPLVAASEPMPTVVLAHGGLWRTGKRAELSVLCDHVVVESGGTMACATVDYRLSGDLGGTCDPPGAATYHHQLTDLASAFAFLQGHAAEYHLDPSAMALGGHSAGGHLSHILNLRWDDFAQPCDASTCPPPVAAIGFEGIYDIAAWDAYDASFWEGQFRCATLQAFGAPPGESSPCVDTALDMPCWEAGSVTHLAQRAAELQLAPVGDALIIHSPGDTWVDIAEATTFGEAMAAAFPSARVVTSIDGSCGTGQHNDPLTQTALASCIVDFVDTSPARTTLD